MPAEKPKKSTKPITAAKPIKATKSTKSDVSKKAGGKELKGAKRVLLSGGNPQIAKADGDTPVQKYICAIPVGWKRDVCRRYQAGAIVRATSTLRDR